MSAMRPTRAEAWVAFAAASVSRADHFFTASVSAEDADLMLAEFERRFEWYDGGYGQYWKEKPTKQAK